MTGVDPLGGFYPETEGKTFAAVRPRDAATLIVIRRDGLKPRLLMGRRNRGHDFMPGRWVFPGGRIDRSDYRVPHAGALKPETERRLRHGATESRAKALALTAIRETFEETGLLLAKAAHPTPRAGHWGPFLAQGALPNLTPLDLVIRAMTPPGYAKRFDTRFLVAPAEALLTLEPQADCGELDEIAWLDIDEALGLDLISVTRFVLRDIAERLRNPDRPAVYLRMVGPRMTPAII
jgi:8-oxo-dGTP pyrophosphatase MutT (NUDIX family)